MYFKLDIRLHELDLPVHPPTVLEYERPHRMTITLRGLRPDEKDQSPEPANAICLAVVEREPSRRQRPMFEALAQDIADVPEEFLTKHWLQVGTSGIVDSDPRIADRVPPALREFANHVYEELLDVATRSFLVLRWRLGLHGPASLAEYRSRTWSLDRSRWYIMPMRFLSTITVVEPVIVPGGAAEWVQATVEAGGTEPVGHELFRDAWDQKESNQRSAITIGVAAAEVGFKQYVGKVAPDARWLIDNLPSPPLVRMLTDYLPTLPKHPSFTRDVVKPPESIIKDLQIGVGLRNQVVHTEAQPVKPETVERILLAVYDLLWVLDYYAGADWALDHVRPEVRRTWLDSD